MTDLPGKTEGTTFLPIHIAIHYLGCAEQTSDGVALRGAFGAHVECLADSVEKVTVVAYDPPTNPASLEDVVDFVAHPKRNNISICSLGPKGTWRSYLQRRSRVPKVVAAASKEWDVALFRMPNRRAGWPFRADQCPRIVTMIGGDVPTVVRSTPNALPKKLIKLAFAHYHDRQFKSIARSSGLFFANSEVLLDKYGSLSDESMLQRSSVRRAEFSYQTFDRMQHANVKFFYAGNLTAAKGSFELMHTFAEVKRTLLPDAELHLAGIGDALEDMQKMVVSLGIENSVVFHGWVPAGKALFDLYSQMDVFLFLSYSEGFPKVVWEAMAHSLPVITTPVGALPRVFTHGEEVLFTPVGETAPVYEAIKRLKDEPELRQHLIRSAFQRAEESTLEYVVDDLLKNIVRRWPELSTLKTASPTTMFQSSTRIINGL